MARVMLQLWYTKWMRILLAAFVVVASVASSPTIGHSHADGGAAHRHLGSGVGHHDDHHDTPHEEYEGTGSVVLGAGEFHFHSLFFGIPITLPSTTGKMTGSAAPFSLADACPSLGASFDEGRYLQLKERAPPPLSPGLLACGMGPGLDTASHCSRQLPASSALLRAQHARSVVLRC